MRNKNRALAIFFSLVPGAGHMYLGLMRQGLELMLLFTFNCLLLSLDRLFYPLLFLMPIWFAYSFFDVINKCDFAADLPLDSHLELLRWLNWPNAGLPRDKAFRWGGYGALAVGGYVMVEGIVLRSLQVYGQIWFGSGFHYYAFISLFRTVVLAALLFWAGWLLLRLSRRADSVEADRQFEQLLPEPDPEHRH